MKKQILKNLFSNYASRGVGLLLSVFLVPFLIYKLGKDAFGLIVMAESLIHLVEMTCASMRTAIARHATFSLSKGNKEAFLEYISTGRYLSFGLSMAVLFLGLLISFNLTRVLHIPEVYAVGTQHLFSLIVITLSISIPNNVFWATLYANQRFDLINFSSSTTAILRAIFIFITFSFLPPRYVSLTTYGFIYLAVTWADNFIVYRLCRKIMPEAVIRLKYFKKDKIKTLLGFGSYTLMNYLSVAIYENVSNILINIFWGTAYNAIYGIGMKFPILMRRLFVEPTWTLAPAFTHLLAKKEKEKLQSLFFAYCKIMAILSLPFSLILILAAKPIINLWVGPDFMLAAQITPILVIPLLIIVPGAACICVISAHGKVKIPGIMGVCSMFLKIAVGFILAKVFSMGLVGWVLGSTLVALVFAVVYNSNYACQLAHISRTRFWKEIYLKPILWAFCVALIGVFAISKMSHLNDVRHAVTSLAVVGGGLILVYGVGVYFFVINHEERQHLRQLLELIGNALTMKSKQPPAEEEGMA